MDVFHEFFLIMGILRFSSVVSDCLWIAPCTLAAIVMRGLTSHPVVCLVFNGGCYICWIFHLAILGKLSWQYMNSMSCMV